MTTVKKAISPVDGKSPLTLTRVQRRILTLRNKKMTDSLVLDTPEARRGAFNQAVDLERQLRLTFGIKPQDRDLFRDMALMTDRAKEILDKFEGKHS
ncbi:hypothetical protein SEA_SIXAMA_42 [Gordonia phage Sixama]|uniref:Uncharacterized protein n=1 Tax=Gordonia phage Sixama TaxID=2653271 RepID=A0A5Q2F1U6_9CAUD|nr:hypothetical protein PP302_gp042 [Gordonia phage Sixama]QGF20221.1 hypothetical protein SEA_SIXAMA_42 [Gordonia phage Sixama]